MFAVAATLGIAWLTSPGYGATGFVQGNTSNLATVTGTTLALPFTNNTTAGNLIAGYLWWGSNKITLKSVTGCGNTYTLTDNPTTGGTDRAAGFYAKNITGGACTVTATFSSSPGQAAMILHEVSGADKTSPLVGSALAYQAKPGIGSNAVSSGSITTKTTGNYVFGATLASTSASVATPGAGFTGRVTGLSEGIASEDEIQAAAGPVSATFTSSTTANYWTLVMAFQPEDSVPPSQPMGLTANPVSISQINLKWTASTDNIGVTGYKIFRNTVQVGTSTTTSYSDTNLSPATPYSYTVSAYDAAGNNSALSTAVVGTTLAPFSFSLGNSGAVSVAQNSSITNTITATLVSGTTATVTFTAAGLPAGVTGTFSVKSCKPTCSTVLTMKTTATTPLGTSVVTITGTAGATVATTSFNLTVAGDTTPPTVTLTAPAPGAQVAGTVTVSATASDNVKVAGVQFFLDGVALGAQDTTSPYSVSWNTTNATNATHTLTAVATDTSGNMTTSAPVMVTVANVGSFNFSLGNSGTTSVTSGSAAANTITVALVAGTAFPVAFVASGLPTGATAGFSAASCTPACSTILTINTAVSSPAGNFTITVTGTAGTVVHTTSFVLAVSGSTVPPMISAVSASTPTSASTTISWITDELADSQVNYGTTPAYGQSSPLNPAMVTQHSVPLSGLTADTLYYYQVQSRNAAGILTVSPGSTFMTTEVPVITLVNHSESVSCATAITCSVTLKGPVTQGNFLVITAWAVNAVHVISLSAGGTYVDGNVRNGDDMNDTRGYLSGGYVLSAAATAGPIVATFSGTTGGAQVNIREYSVSSGSLVFDAASDNFAMPTANPIVAPTLTLSGANDLIVSWAGASTNIASVAFPYGNADIANDKTGSGTADLLNTTTGTSASWTAAGTPTAGAVASMAFGFGTTPCTSMGVMDSSGGTNGSPVTSATLAASTFGTFGNGNGDVNWSWQAYDPNGGYTWSATAHKSLTTPLRFCAGGASWVDNSTLGLQYDTTKGSLQYQQLVFPGHNLPGAFVANTSSTGMWFSTSLPQTATVNQDIVGLWGNNGYLLVTVFGDGNNIYLKCEFINTSCNALYPIQTNAWYWITLQYNYQGTHQGAIYDSNMNVIGSFSNPADKEDDQPTSLLFGMINQQALSPGFVMNFDGVKFCYIGTCPFPVLP